MLNDSQEQNVSDGSTAIQAAGNVTLIGPSVTEVRDLCVLFLRDNFPKLQEAARQAAEEHVRQFANQLERELADNLSSVVVEKLADPDVQATINDAVQAAARKGEAANPEILAKLILQKVSGDCGPFQDIVFAEAVKVAPLLTKEQIAFLAFVLVMQVYVFPVESWEQLDRLYERVSLFSEPGFGISEAQRKHIHYSGAASVAGRNAVHPTYNMFEAMELKYQKHGLVNFRAISNGKVPALVKLIHQYTKDKGDAVALTSVGIAIVCAYLSYFGFGPVDLLADKE